ncbi:hypothetical protein EMCRGX_G022178 [Ephydatia muelleri]
MASKHEYRSASLPKLVGKHEAPGKKKKQHSTLSAKGPLLTPKVSASTEDLTPRDPSDQADIAELRFENTALKEELATLRSLYAQLTHEAPLERFSESRVHLLKSQVFQLERQVLILNQAISTRTCVLSDLQNTMDMLLQRLQGIAKTDDGHVTLAPCEVDDIVDRVKVIKGRLAKGEQVTERVTQPLLSIGRFLKPAKNSSEDRWSDHKGPVSVVDMCMGGTAHINLQYVSRLESKLACLYGNLCRLHASLETTPTGRAHLTRPMEDHLSGVVLDNCKMVGDCCRDLLCLSLLVPEAPWGPLKGAELADVGLLATSDAILERLPPSVRGKTEVKSVVEAAVKSFNYQHHMATVKSKALQSELDFHKSVYEAQVNYIHCLFQALRDGYKVFEQSLQEAVCQPMQGILSAYLELSREVSDDALKKFLVTFKAQYPQLVSTLEKLKVSPIPAQQEATEQRAPVEAISLFGNHFFQTLQLLEERCLAQRQQALHGRT